LDSKNSIGDFVGGFVISTPEQYVASKLSQMPVHSSPPKQSVLFDSKKILLQLPFVLRPYPYTFFRNNKFDPDSIKIAPGRFDTTLIKHEFSNDILPFCWIVIILS